MIFSLLLLPLLAMLAVPLVLRWTSGNVAGWLLSVFPASMFILLLLHIPDIGQGKVFSLDWNWFPSMQVAFAFRLDGLSQLYLLLISGIGFPVVIYSKAYFGEHDYVRRYFLFLFLFLLGMTGAVLADDIISLFVFWEITSFCSFFLIALNHKSHKAQKVANDALFITMLGGLCLLAGFILLAIMSGTYRISLLYDQSSQLLQQPGFQWMLALILIGAFTKSAQFPFSFWLPGAMAAPTPVSAYLHSATMVQLGIYLLSRFHPVFAASEAWGLILVTIGSITMLSSVFAAFKQLDMKLMLAYTTVTALGSLVFTLGSSNPMTIKASVSFFLVHALYKATLFMAVGDIQHQTGSRHLKKVSGVYKAMPLTFLAVCVAAGSMAGLPPLLGFYVKELVYEASLAPTFLSIIMTAIVVLANMMMAAIAYKLVFIPFKGKARRRNLKEANIHMSLNALLVAIVTMILSVFPEGLDHYVLSPAAAVILGKASSVSLLPTNEGINASLLLSGITLLGAVVLYRKRRFLRRRLIGANILYWLVPQRIYQIVMDSCLTVAKGWTVFWQSGYLHRYTMIVFVFMFVFIGSFFAPYPLTRPHLSSPFLLSIISLWLVGSAAMLLWVCRFIKGLIALGVFGLGLAFFFVIQGAPDVAMTQILIESLMIILIVFSLSGQGRWPDLGRESTWHRWTRGAIALGVGLLTAVMVNGLLREPFDTQLGQYFLDHSLLIGHGRNVVNVILVDFRALDTLGEVIVVLLAAVGIYGLLPKRRRGL
ncbi:MAG: DUF4040 domain-containing protein [Legionellaceae bacterium]|nr:DUF4040 domain-containing protein [Legionellaceae bacterium]